MVATPQQTNETGTRKSSTRTSSAHRRAKQPRHHDGGSGGTDTEQRSSSPEVSAEVGGQEVDKGDGDKAALVSHAVTRSCDTCQHGQLDNGFIACGLNLFAGSVKAESIVTKGMAHECESFGMTATPEPLALSLQPSSLDILVGEINALYGQLEQAEQVACQAAHSALEFAREMGDRLSQVKKLAGHGNWEQVREQIKSPRTQRPIPSSTAALYMRIADRWNELDAAAIATIREASEALKKPRLNPQPVADLQPIIHEKDLVDSLEGLRDDFNQRKAAAEERAIADNSSSIWQPGDRLTPKNGGIVGEVVSVSDAGVVVNQDDGRSVTSTRMSPAEVAKKFDVAPPETAQQVDGLAEVYFAVRSFSRLNNRRWNEQKCDEVAAAVLDFLAEY